MSRAIVCGVTGWMLGLITNFVTASDVQFVERSGQGLRSFDMAANQNMIFDFTNVASVDNWTEMSDTVRTVGMSKAAMPNGAGFAGVRVVGNLDLSRYQALKLRARAQGPNTHYKMVLRHRGEDQEPFPTYENFFTAPTGDFGEVELKLSDFVPYYRGRQVPDADPLEPARVTSLGLQVYGGVYAPTKQAGPGSLEIDWIAGIPAQ
ncbi:hypothetical protein B566_EDAN010538 [Ephemera danica]|nr:hypothetical protein B566_EDAN010538 [Ephemera danica]